MLPLKVRDIGDEYNFNDLHPNGRLTNTIQQIKDTQSRIFGYLLNNPNASEAYVHVFYMPKDEVKANTPPNLIVKLPASGGVAWDFLDPKGKNSTGLSIVASTTETGFASGPSTGLTGTFFYV